MSSIITHDNHVHTRYCGLKLWHDEFAATLTPVDKLSPGEAMP